MVENDLVERVQSYLENLGYPKYLLSSDVRTNYNERVDLVVYSKGNPYIVVEVKLNHGIFKTEDADNLRFDPSVREAQSYAIALNAPYYLLTDGRDFLWFKTDNSGRPELLAKPIYPPENNHLSDYYIMLILNELREFFFRSGVSSPRGEAAIIVYAKLLHEYGDHRLEESLINSHSEHNSSLRSDVISIPLQELLQLSYYSDQSIRYGRDRTYYARAFELVNRISFREVEPKILINALDKVFIGEQMLYDGPRLPRWLADFLVRLSQPQPHDIVLDIYSNYGDIAAAVLLHEEQPQTENLVGISPNAISALWAQIQQIILSNGRNRNNILLGDTPPYNQWGWSNGQALEHPTQIIVAPPFGAELNNEEARKYNGPHGITQSEDLYLELAINWVSTGGRVVAIVPEGLLLSGARRNIREFLQSRMRITAIISLGTFLSRTRVKSSILILDKEQMPEPYDIFMYHIGEITNGNTLDSLTIPQIDEAFKAFKRWVEKQEHNDKQASLITSSHQLDIGNWAVVHYQSPGKLFDELVAKYATASLGDLAKIKRGSHIKRNANGSLPVIGPGMIRSMILDAENIERTAKDALPRNAPTVEVGDIVLNAIGTYAGSAALVEEGFEGAFISRHVIRIRVDSKVILPEYLAVALNSSFVSKQAGLQAYGTTIQGLAAGNLSGIIIPIPSITVQQALIMRMRKARNELFLAQDHLEAAKLNFTKSIQDLSEWGLE